MAALGSAGRLSAVLLAAAAGLALLAAWPWVRVPASLPMLPAGADPTANASPAALPQLPPYERFVETQRRPLFVATRRPPPVAASPAPAPPPSFDRGRIAGVVVIGDTKVALIRDPRSGKVQRVGEGETVDGWTVRAISPEKLTLVSERGGSPFDIELDRAASAPGRR